MTGSHYVRTSDHPSYTSVATSQLLLLFCVVTTIKMTWAWSKWIWKPISHRNIRSGRNDKPGPAEIRHGDRYNRISLYTWSWSTSRNWCSVHSHLPASYIHTCEVNKHDELLQYIRGRGFRLWNVDIRMSNGEWIVQKMGCVVFMQSVVFTVYDVGCRDANRTLPSSTPTRRTIQTLYTL